MESCCCLEYKIDPEPTHTMNTPEPFNDLSWSDDPLHSPNRTIYIEKLRARVKELESENAHMLQVMEAVCAAVKTVLDRTNPGQSLLAKLTALEKERDKLQGELLASSLLLSQITTERDQLKGEVADARWLLENIWMDMNGHNSVDVFRRRDAWLAKNPTPYDATERQKE